MASSRQTLDSTGGKILTILIGCEFSGIVRDAFIHEGYDAISCDLLDSEKPGPHIKEDIRNILKDNWEMMIVFPPCTHLAISGARWFKEKQNEQKEALQFIIDLLNAPIPHIALENPIGIISTQIKKPEQIIQPWQFGHPETKATCLWLKNLPLLYETNRVKPTNHSIHYEPPSPDRWKNRSRTFEGIAKAMAQQWGPPEARY